MSVHREFIGFLILNNLEVPFQKYTRNINQKQKQLLKHHLLHAISHFSIKKAHKALKNNNIKLAKIYFTKAIKAEPKSLIAYLELMKLIASQNNSKKLNHYINNLPTNIAHLLSSEIKIILSNDYISKARLSSRNNDLALTISNF